MKILIIKPSSLGDVVQSLPLLCNLRLYYPDAQIDWVIFKPYGELLDDHPDLDHVLSIAKPRLSWKTYSEDLRPLQQWMRETKYDLAIDLQGLFRSGVIAAASRAKKIIGLASAREGAGFFYHEKVFDHAPHAAARYLQVLDFLKIPYDPSLFRLEAREPLPDSLQTLRSYIVIHPYTRWKTKLWPWRHYQTLAQKITDPIVLIGNGPWFPCEGDQVIDLRGQLSLQKTMAVLNQARAVISTDSGPAHLAAALGTKTIALFGATDPKKTAPVGPYVNLLRASIPCSPCLRRQCLNSEPMRCMKDISIANVLNLLE